MKIRSKLTLLFTLLTAAILLAFAATIYFTAKENREKEFYSLLKKEALTKAKLFFNAKVEAKTLQDIYKNNRQILNEVEVAIYDSHFQLLYHDAVDIDFVKETPEMINEIYRKGNIQFYQNNWQVVGLQYEFQNKKYVVTATAFDKYGYRKLNNLLKSSIIVFVISILFIYVAGRFFSKKAFEPVSEMTAKAKTISATNLDLRLNTNGSKDELAELAETFNQMLNRIEHSFDAQKHFVSNIAHESRTPLAAIITELELSLNKTRSTEEYQSAIRNALSDAQKLARLFNSLLDFAKANYDATEIAFKEIRLDEILLDAQQQLIKQNPNYHISIKFENENSDEEISIKGNEYLLKTALVNLMENGCKFSSDKSCQVSIEPNFTASKISVRFTDNGIGIPQKDLPNIFTPFFRGENKKFADGNGIGLSLTKKIILLHKGNIVVNSQSNKGTTFTIELPL